MKNKKIPPPMRIFHSALSGKYYATRAYKEQNGRILITGIKHDVTGDVLSAIAAALTATRSKIRGS